MTIEFWSDESLLEGLLGELRYIFVSGDIRDVERNSVEIRDAVARRLGFADYDAWEAAAKE